MKYILTREIDGEKHYLDFDGEWTTSRGDAMTFSHFQVMAVYSGFNDGFDYELDYEEE